MKYYLFPRFNLLLLSIVCLFSTCYHTGQTVDKVSAANTESEKPKPSLLHITSPLKDAFLKVKDNANIQFELPDSLIPDSILIRMDADRIAVLTGHNRSFLLKTGGKKVGVRNLQVFAFLKNKKTVSDQINFTLLPDKPKMYTYKIIKTYPHDKDAFTQGLFYENGFLYEGTGQKGKSSLRKEKLNGEIINSLNISSDYFGEGITTFDDKIIQITWTEQTAFIYDKATFKQLSKLNYAIAQGWGITYDGKNLIMSDGSNIIYFLNKEDLSELHRIDVFDDQGPIANLNELEYIDGEIWANIWQTDWIVRIDPKTGAVLGKINMAGLLTKQQKEDADVLNGIAWDPKTRRIFVTGKNWPSLFEISVNEKH